MYVDGEASVSATRAVAVLVGVLVLAAGSTAASAPGGPSARLVYARSSEASSCPAESALRAAVAARFGYDPFFPWAKTTIVVQVSRTRALYVARVQLLDEQGIAQGMRELSSAAGDCSEIFDATALAISIALDAASKPSAPEPAQDASAPAPLPSSPPLPSVAATIPSAPTSQPASLPAPETTPEREPASSAGQVLHAEVGIDALASLGAEPSASPGVSAFFRGRLQAWSLALEFRADAPESMARSEEIGGGRVQSWTGGAGVAPCLHLGHLVACATGMAEVLRASGQDIDPRFTRSTFFATAGVRAGFEWPISSLLTLRVRADGVVNLVRVNLVLGDDDVWRSPPVSGTLGAGVVARFR